MSSRTARLSGFLAALSLVACGEIPTPPPAPPPDGAAGYSLALASPALTVTQGTSITTTAVHLLRSRFAGAVTLSVENLPPGVEINFSPGSSVSGGVAALVVGVDADAAMGTFSNLVVRGVAPGLPDQTAPLSLTVVPAPFALTLWSEYLTVAQGSQLSAMVHVIRRGLVGPLTLTVDTGDSQGHMPLGLGARFSPSQPFGDSAILTITATSSVVPGTYELCIYGETPTGRYEGLRFDLTVTARTSP